ncbi:MAG: hypothetical protein E5W69_08790, partial [Mesorhizobium sp.]
MWVGDWKDITPEDTINLKRFTDKNMNVYRHLFNESLFLAYDEFIHTVFQTYNGPGEDAKIRAEISGVDGNRTTDCHYPWNKAWNKLFEEDSVPRKKELSNKYNALMHEAALG